MEEYNKITENLEMINLIKFLDGTMAENKRAENNNQEIAEAYTDAVVSKLDSVYGDLMEQRELHLSIKKLQDQEYADPYIFSAAKFIKDIANINCDDPGMMESGEAFFKKSFDILDKRKNVEDSNPQKVIDLEELQKEIRMNEKSNNPTDAALKNEEKNRDLSDPTIFWHLGDECPYSKDAMFNSEDGANSFQIKLNEIQEGIVSKFYKNFRGNLHHFLTSKNNSNFEREPQLLYIVQGGPGAGKTTLVKELLNRISLYITRVRNTIVRAVCEQLSRQAKLSRILLNIVQQFNKLNKGYSISAMTGVAATIVGNNCITAAGNYKLPYSTTTQVNRAHKEGMPYQQQNNAFEKPKSERKIVEMRLQWEEKGIYLHIIDEVNF
jgi:hypothetical protein